METGGSRQDLVEIGHLGALVIPQGRDKEKGRVRRANAAAWISGWGFARHLGKKPATHGERGQK